MSQNASFRISIRFACLPEINDSMKHSVTSFFETQAKAKNMLLSDHVLLRANGRLKLALYNELATTRFILLNGEKRSEIEITFIVGLN